MVATFASAGLVVLLLWAALRAVRSGTLHLRFGVVTRRTSPVAFGINIAVFLLGVVTFAAVCVALALR
jgi:hypothetical protein